MTPNEVARRLAAYGPPGRRSSLNAARPVRERVQAAGAQATGNQAAGGDSARVWPRGDHDLNPDFYDPQAALVPAAVLLPIIEHDNGATLLFTRRTDHLDVHAGQISFPGGRQERGETLQEAALRETEEEVGLPPQQVRLIGELDTYVTRTGFEVAPLVGVIRPPLSVAPDSFEVAEVFEVPLTFFLDPANRERHTREFQGRNRHFYAYPYGGYYIWGATAGMLVNLAEVLADNDLAAE